MLTALLSGAPAAPLLLQCHSRLQPVCRLPSLRHFGWVGAAGQQPLVVTSISPVSWSGPAATPAPSKARRGRSLAWRCLAVQQLHAVDSAGAAAATAAGRSIGPGEVHLWWLDPRKVCGEAELRRCTELLTEDELAYCADSGEETVQRERLLARALVRSVLAGYLPGAPHPRSLLFQRNSHGKPRLEGWMDGPVAMPNGHALCFNLTHTPSMIGLAVTVDGLVGLDVENQERRIRSDPMRLAQRRFSHHEIADLQACPDEAARAAYFLQLWTLKEAYVKALGRGISAPPGLRSFTFRVVQQQQQQFLNSKQGANGAGQPQQEADQEQRQPNVPPPLPQQLLVWANGGWRSSSDSNTSSSSVDFTTAAPDLRCWQFALLQPAPGLMSALCIERPDRANIINGQGGEQQTEGLRLLCYEAAPWGDEARPIDPQLLAFGQYTPCP